MSICATLQYGPSPWLPSTFMPTMPGTLIFTRPLAGPLEPAY
jgi:glucosamine-6-phosphate deaminase